VAKLRYNKTFKEGIATILFCIVLFGSIVVFFIAAQGQYDRLVSGMKSMEATIIDVDHDMHIKGPNDQEIYIEYEVDGIVYHGELRTDTAISFDAGTGASYSIGDKVPILYDPQNPEIIASPRSLGVGHFWLVVALIGLALVLVCLIAVLKNHRRYLVTREEYDKEREKLKRGKIEAKKRKKQLKLARREKYAKRRKIIKIILIILAVPVVAFILFVLLGALLMAHKK
jgi:uncharacterized ion transporter superfamily protein YfcC